MSGEYEHLDTTPVEIPTRLRLPQTRTDQIRAFIREELSRKAAHDGQESFEEADDIEPDDDEGALPYSAYEERDLEPPAFGQPGSPPAKPAVAVPAVGGAPADPAQPTSAPTTAGGADGKK